MDTPEDSTLSDSDEQAISDKDDVPTAEAVDDENSSTKSDPDEEATGDKSESPWDSTNVLLWFDCGSHSKTDVPEVLLKVLEAENETQQQDAPELALSEHRIKAKALVHGKYYDEALKEKIRCVAWARLVYGDGHWQIARAYAELAEAYLKLRKLPLQAVKHAETSRDILLQVVSNKTQEIKANDEDRLFSLLTLELVYFVLGVGNLGLKKMNLADSFLNKSLLVSSKKETEFGLLVGDVVRRLETLTCLGKVCKMKAKLGLALEHFEKAIDLATEKIGKDAYQLIQLYVLSGKTELSFSKDATPDRAIELFETAKDIAESNKGKKSLEYANCCEMIFHGNYSYDDDVYHERAESSIKEAVEIYATEYPSKHSKLIRAYELLSQFYISKGRLREAEDLLVKILEKKMLRYGDPSEQAGDSHKALGGLYLSQGKLKQGAQSLVSAKRCFDVVLGKQHSKSKNVEKWLSDIKKLPVSKEINLAGENLRDRPLFRTVHNTKLSGYTKPVVFN